MKSEYLYLAGAALMLLDALAYSFGALHSSTRALLPETRT